MEWRLLVEESSPEIDELRNSLHLKKIFFFGFLGGLSEFEGLSKGLNLQMGGLCPGRVCYQHGYPL